MLGSSMTVHDILFVYQLDAAVPVLLMNGGKRLVVRRPVKLRSLMLSPRSSNLRIPEALEDFKL